MLLKSLLVESCEVASWALAAGDRALYELALEDVFGLLAALVDAGNDSLPL